MLAWAGDARAVTYYVAPGGNGSGSLDSPWGSLQSAVGASSPVRGGDSIVVRTGTYALGSAVSFQKSGEVGAPITLVAEAGVTLNVTASNAGGAFDLYQAHDWVIDGFRVNEASLYGIALHGCTNVTIQNCYVYRAEASGIIVNVSNWGSDDIYPVPQNWNIKLLNNTIDGANWKSGDNEAVSLWATDGFEIAGNTVIHCRHEGIDVKTGARNGSVHNNTVIDDYDLWPGTGMGVYVDGWHYETYNIDIYQNVIHDSEEGFEVQCEDCTKPGTTGSVHDLRYFDNVVYHNTDIQSSGWKGRAMSFFASDGAHPIHDIHIFNNTFVGNQRLGIHVDNPDIKNLFIRNNIIVSNGGADIQVDRATSVTIENNLLSKPVSNAVGAAVTAKNNTVADPLFVNAAANDYHLQAGSPAIDKAAGTDVASIDVEGKARPAGAAADLGAFEYGATAIDGGTGGARGTGGVVGAGGAPGAGGATSARSPGGTDAGNTPPGHGVAGSDGHASDGCSCRVGSRRMPATLALLVPLALLVLAARQRLDVAHPKAEGHARKPYFRSKGSSVRQ